ncbi:hypothetical protein F4679DRAFT_159414 [Xylaria curta]|nr:hypothetical protein F4679DRAFT_159414 [Xylaria curta]
MRFGFHVDAAWLCFVIVCSGSGSDPRSGCHWVKRGILPLLLQSQDGHPVECNVLRFKLKSGSLRPINLHDLVNCILTRTRSVVTAGLLEARPSTVHGVIWCSFIVALLVFIT